MAKLNIALTLPGEGSLGAFEAGAVSALIVAVQAMIEKDANAVSVDAITGTSSGSLTAVLAAAALLTGADPVGPLRRAWVSEPSLAALWGHSRVAPLSLDRAREVGAVLIGRMLLGEEQETEGREEEPRKLRQSAVTLEFALTCLRGFSYRLPRSTARNLRARRPVVATSYIDWSRHALGGESQRGLEKQLADALDAAIASASDPLVFPPTLLNRSRDRQEYARRNVKNFPVRIKGLDVDVRDDSRDRPSYNELWYSDGALVDREPLGRCLRLARSLDQARSVGKQNADAQRLVLVVRPHTDRAPDKEDPAWTGADEPPRWKTTLGRAYRIMATHSLYEDLRRVEKTNNRIAWRDHLVATLTGLLGTHPDAQAKLTEVLREINDERVAWCDQKGEPGVDGGHVQQSVGGGKQGQAGPADGQQQLKPETEALLREAIGYVAGIHRKEAVDVEVVAAPDSVQLAGGARGFLVERLRANDFLVGYRVMLGWLETGLCEYQVPEVAGAAGLKAARDGLAGVPGWRGGISVSRRTAVRGSALIVRAGLRAGRLGLGEIRIPRKPSR